MDLDDLKLALNKLLSGMEHKPDDRHELHMMLQEKLAEMRAMGMPIPDDLLRFEAELEEAEEGQDPAGKG